MAKPDESPPPSASPREAFALFGISLAMLLGSGQGFSLSSPGASGLGYSLDEGFLFEYGVVASGLAILSLLLVRSGSSLLGECSTLLGYRFRRGAKSAVPSQEPWARAWTLGIVGIAAALGISLVDQPMRYDEAFTSLFFVQPGGAYLFYYPLPNNHVLYTLLAAGSNFLLGTGPASLRWPALIFGLAAVMLAFRLGRKVSGKHGGYFASAAMATFPFLVTYWSMGRGYSLLVLLVLGMVLVVVDDDGFPWEAKPAALAVLGSLSLLVMPSAIYPIAGLSLWAACVHFGLDRDAKVTLTRFVLPYGSLGLLITSLLYVPVLLVNRLHVVAQNRFFTSLDGMELLRATIPHLQATWGELSRGVGLAGITALALLTLLGIYAALRGRQRTLVLLLPATIMGSAVVFLLKQSIPFPRTWIFVIPLFLLLADAGFAWLLGNVSSPFRRVLLALLLLGSAGYALSLWKSSAIQSAPDGGASPHAAAMARKIDEIAEDGDWLCARVPHDVPLRYYLSKQHPTGHTEFKETGRVHYILEGSFAGNQFVSAQQVRKEAQVGTLAIYGFDSSMSINDAGISFHCWLRSGVFRG